MDAKMSEALQITIAALMALSAADHPLFPDARAALTWHSIAQLLLTVRKCLPDEIQERTEHALHFIFRHLFASFAGGEFLP